MSSFLSFTMRFLNNFFQRLVNIFSWTRKNFFSWYNKNFKLNSFLLVFILVFAFFFYVFFWSPPSNFPEGAIVTIEKGATLSETAELLQEQHIVRSIFWFKVFAVLFGGDNYVFAGDYFFKKPSTIFSVARRITADEHGLEPVSITVFEGQNIFEIADLFEKKFGKFNKEKFLEIATEGYLFPDTYLFLPNVEAAEVIAVMKKNFSEKITELSQEIEDFGKPLEDIIKMASIVEKEARNMNTRRTIAGVLWNRLSIDMPLQVDVSFAYINGKNSFELTTEDLTIDSLYNSYKYKGLPPTPIANPGLSAIQATVTPIETPYLYFLSDKEGVMHYARTFEGHKQNKRLYLGK